MPGSHCAFAAARYNRPDSLHEKLHQTTSNGCEGVRPIGSAASRPRSVPPFIEAPDVSDARDKRVARSTSAATRFLVHVEAGEWQSLDVRSPRSWVA